MSSFAESFSTHEAQYKAAILYDTWGHLDAKPNEVYPCRIVIACNGREILITSSDCKVTGPAFYYDSNEYFFNKLAMKGKVGIFVFEGTYQMYKSRPRDADTICYFKGRITKIKV